MLQASNLFKAYGGQVIFDKVSFTISPGERVGLVGRNGHGKTTLFRMILGHEHPDSGTICTPAGYRIGHLAQHIRFTAPTVVGEACLSLPASDETSAETYKAETILLGLGFSSGDFHRDPSELSGGFQVRLNLAKVLISDPGLLLLDEPTNYLDILSMRWLSRFLRGWKKELILITHDRSFMDSVTTHTMAIHRCSIRKTAGPTEKIYRQLLMEEEIHEKTRINDEKKRREIEQFINRFRAKATKASAVQSRIRALQKKERLTELSDIRNLEFTFNEASFTGRHLMEVKDLAFGFDTNGPFLIEGLSFYVGKKDRIAIIGKNGKGKTTLLNLLAGELAPLNGSVSRHKHLRLAYFGQTNIQRLHPDKTVEEEIMDAHPDHSRGPARSICGAMMFPGDQAMKKISVLSGGEKSRVLLGKLLVSPANLLLLDEPTNHLDMESTESLVDAVCEFGGAVLFVTHSEMILHALATRLIVFDGGRVFFFEGTYQDFLDRVGWQDEQGDALPVQDSTPAPRQAANKKQLRRLRAELINEKSRTLGSIQDKIAAVEGEIMALEDRNSTETTSLIEASRRGDGHAIGRLSGSIHSSTLRIEQLFAELELLHKELDTRSREFEDQISSASERE